MKVFSSPPMGKELQLGWNCFPAKGKFAIATSKNNVTWMLKIRFHGWAYVYIKSLMEEGKYYAVKNMAGGEREEPAPNATPLTYE